jgi:imidazolonepropionase-like amidohydrolase
VTALSSSPVPAARQVHLQAGGDLLSPHTLVLEASRMFTGREVIAGPRITIVGNTIASVQYRQEAPPWEPIPASGGATVLSFPGATILPGLIDAHVHLALLARADLKARRSTASDGEALLKAGVRVADTYLSRGITTLRDLGDRQRLNLRVRQALAGRECPGPRVLAPGRALHRRNAYGNFIGTAVDGERQLLEGATQELAAGADFVKVVASGIIDFQCADVTAPVPFSAEELRSLVDLVHDAGRTVAAHASGAAGVTAAVRGGVDFVEHGFFAPEEAAAAFRSGACTWVPTFVPVEVVAGGHILEELSDAERAAVRGILDRHAALLRDVHAAGGAVIAGSDAGSPGVWEAGGVLGELGCFLHAGLAPQAALERATRGAAEALGIGHLVGSIAPGKCADLLVVGGNPLASLDALRDVKLVVRDGTIVFRSPGD